MTDISRIKVHPVVVNVDTLSYHESKNDKFRGAQHKNGRPANTGMINHVSEVSRKASVVSIWIVSEVLLERTNDSPMKKQPPIGNKKSSIGKFPEMQNSNTIGTHINEPRVANKTPLMNKTPDQFIMYTHL
jgi:hypothetical protein